MKWQNILQEAKAEADGLAVERLVAYVRKLPRANMLAHLNEDAETEEERLFRTLLERLKNGEPVQYLIEEAPFWQMDLMVSPQVLIPRFDTEILVARALSLIDLRAVKSVLDLCTGSGAIALAIACERPAVRVCGSDLSASALDVARRNGLRFAPKVEFRQGDLFVPWQRESFDLITVNPPYISAAEMEDLPSEVKKEPRLALFGGDDGLLFYRRLAGTAKNHLNPGGTLIMEIGYQQAEAVMALLRKAGFVEIEVQLDSQGLNRVVEGRRESGGTT